MNKTIRYMLIIVSAISFFSLVFIVLPAAKPIIMQGNVQYIIDAGHGLPDGGAIGIDGTTEQQLNLQISQKLYSKFDGGSAVMVRSDENGLTIVDGSIREKKISDMHERIKIANRYPDALWISIHMNTYPNASVYGCQIFYKKDDEISKTFAENLQEKVNSNLQPNHTRNVKSIDSSLYLYKNIQNHTVLIECGFISNNEELNKLKNEEYQMKISDLIFDTVQEEKNNGKSKE